MDTRQKSIIQKLFIRSSESLLKIRFKFSTSYVSTLLLSILKLEATGIKTMVIMAFVKLAYGSTAYYHLTSIYLFKVNNWNTRTLCQISSKLTINTPTLQLTLNMELHALNRFHILFWCSIFIISISIKYNMMIFWLKHQIA